MEHAAKEAAFLHRARRERLRTVRGSTGHWRGRGCWGRCGRCLEQAFLRAQTGGSKNQAVENDGRTNHRRVKHENYQSSMKSIFASLIVASFAASVLGKDRPCVFRVHAEANPNDTASFAASVPALLSGKRVAIERAPRLSEGDVVAFYPYAGKDGGFGALFQFDEHGRVALDELSVEKRGRLLFVLVNGRPVAQLEIDQRVTDGRIYIASGLTKADIDAFRKCWRLVGEKKKR